MTRKIRFGILICLGIIIISLSSTPSQAIDLKKDKAYLGGTTAGVQGAAGEASSGYNRCKKECTPENASCQALIKQYEELEPKINALYDEESKIIDENIAKDKKIKKIADEVQNLLNQLAKEKKGTEIDSLKGKLSTKFNDLENAIGPMNPRINIISSELKQKNTNLEKIDKQLTEIANKKFIKESKNKDKPADEVKPNSSEEKKNDVVDVNKKAYLKHGDLVAWGIPGIPSIPVPKVNSSKPVHQDKTVSEKQVSDQTYQALRTVEQNSEKVSQSDVDLFLQQLNAQTAKN